MGAMGGTQRDARTASTRHKYRFFYTFSTHSDSLTPCLLCKLTRLLRRERGPPMRRSLLPAVLSLSLLLSALATAHAASYTFTTINPYGFTHAHGINDNGQIVGLSGNHGFLWDGSTFTSIDVPSAIQTHALGLNNNGQIVGYFRDTTGRFHGFLTSDGSTFTTIDADPSAWYNAAFGINTVGEIVGGFISAIEHGFLTSDGATFTTIDVPGATATVACGINDKGQIVGWFIDATRTHGFLKDSSTFTPIDVPGATATGGFRINNSGQIVGYFTDASGDHGFLATPAAVDMSPPLITVAASPATLWPPNGKRVAVTVSGTITDTEPGGSGVKAGSAAYVVMDEYGQIQPSGNLTLGEGGQYGFPVALEASRRGNDPDGRRYTIAVSAKDNLGNPGVKTTLVT